MADKQPTQLSDKLIVATVATFALGVILYFALGMPGMNHGSNSSMAGMDMSSDSPTHRIVDPATFAAALAQPGAVVINVHVPYDGEIEGTHLFMPFDEIDAAALPEGRGTPLVVYCRSGSMSSTAVVTLAALGYTNIVELDGGMNAWQASGNALRPSPSGGG
jgi:rhodanese-related sulfurtransferase